MMTACKSTHHPPALAVASADARPVTRAYADLRRGVGSPAQNRIFLANEIWMVTLQIRHFRRQILALPAVLGEDLAERYMYNMYNPA